MSDSPNVPIPAWIDLHDHVPVREIAQAVADGETWLYACTIQSTTPWHLLERESGISERRLAEIDQGSAPTRQELSKLARAWRLPLDQLIPVLPRYWSTGK